MGTADLVVLMGTADLVLGLDYCNKGIPLQAMKTIFHTLDKSIPLVAVSHWQAYCLIASNP